MDTKTVQKFLNKHGHNLKVDGKIGPRTRAAMKNFRVKEGVPVEQAISYRNKRLVGSGILIVILAAISWVLYNLDFWL